ncbi:ester cyclase [Roseococcus sp.]|uniref:ester cyclase n=1 Tax=Roseococcus sp. TaxID=2109646 RepID=UPI003BAC205E
MSPSAGTIFRLWFEEVWNKNDTDRITTYLAPDGIIYALDLAGGDAQGPDAFRAFFEQFMESFSDVHFTVHEVMETEDMAAGRWSAQLTHSGDGFGFPASGETVTVTGMSMIRLKDGLVVEGWNEWDRLRMATTCRMVAPPA